MSHEPDIPWTRVAAFVRQHTHDLRNGLNGLDLESALLQELVDGEEGEASVRRLRKQLRALAEQLRSLASVFHDPQPNAGPIAARELLLIWRETHAAMKAAPQVRWVEELAGEQVNVDAEMMGTVFSELLSNAAAFSPDVALTVTARANGEEAVFELREPKTTTVDTSTWTQPFTTTRRAGFGLGLCTAKRMMEANGGTLVQRSEEGGLTTQVVLPVLRNGTAR